jgi:hypothetical protein
MSLIRTLLKAVAVAAISAWAFFFLGVFITLIALLIVSAVTSSHPDMSISYRIVGLTAACTAAVLGFIGAIVYDVRRLSATGSK